MTSLQENIEYYNSLIPELYSDKFPKDFSLTPKGWALQEAIVNRNSLTLQDNTEIRPIGTLDVEFLDDNIIQAVKNNQTSLVKNYPCGLNCPGCFSEDSIYGNADRLLTYAQVFDVIDDAIEIGLSSIKFLGPGEMFNNKNLFEILDACEKRNLEISIFTKGAELGDDTLAKEHYGHLGITSAKDLVNKVSEYKTVRILLGFNSFDATRQNKLVGSATTKGNYQIQDFTFKNRGIENYTEKRNNALKNLVESGFNSPENGQRLSLIAAPLMLNQADEIGQMYIWAAKRNIPLITTPSMESGSHSIKLSQYNKKIDESHEKIVDIYTSIYRLAIENGILTQEQIKNDGISAYPGTAPCNQVANGLYLRLNGQIQMCPGCSSANAIYGNIHEQNIIDIWKNSWNYKLGNQMNNWCTAKTTGLPKDVANKVIKNLKL